MIEQKAISVPKVGEKVVCDHCGLPVPANMIRPNDDLQFCCSGCRQVYAIINECGYDQYYKLRDMEKPKPQAAKVSGRSFDDFDDPAFQEKHVTSSSPSTNSIDLYLEGVHCAACVWLVENLQNNLPGVTNIRLDLPRAKATVQWNPEEISLSSITKTMDSIGYLPHPYTTSETQLLRKEESRNLLRRLGLAAACTINIMILQGALYAGEYSGIDPNFETFFRWTSFLLAIPVVLYSARPFFSAAIGGLRQRVPHMDLPISLAILVGFIYSSTTTIRGEGHIYFDSITALVTLLLAGRFIQFQAQRSAMDLADRMRGAALPDFARLLIGDGASKEVPSNGLRGGDRIEVRPGETVPADGVIVAGNSTVNNAALTGEAEPVKAGSGMPIHSGSINLHSRIEIQVQAAGELTRVGSLMKLVDQAFSNRAPIVQLADRMSRYFVVAVLSLAAVTALIWSAHSGEIILERVIALLVITCPCALGLATPVAISVSLSKAARVGIFIKHADVIERLKTIRTMLLDKTGTVTTGDMSVLDFTGDKKLAARIHALESRSSHPIAAAFLRSFAESADTSMSVENVEERIGRGIAGTVDGVQLAIGNARFMAELGVSVPEDSTPSNASDAKQILTRIYIATDGAIAATATIGDPIRPESEQILGWLAANNWKLEMVSGDHRESVLRVAEKLDLSPAHIHSEMTPEDKLELVQSRKAMEHSTGLLMVGDGVNDAAALAAADVGVSVYGSSGASVSAADVVLTRSGLKPLVALLDGAKRTMHVIYRNLAFSLLYNITGAILAITGIVEPLVAAVLMPISSLIVIISSIVGQGYDYPAQNISEGR